MFLPQLVGWSDLFRIMPKLLNDFQQNLENGWGPGQEGARQMDADKGRGCWIFYIFFVGIWPISQGTIHGS